MCQPRSAGGTSWVSSRFSPTASYPPKRIKVDAGNSADRGNRRRRRLVLFTICWRQALHTFPARESPRWDFAQQTLGCNRIEGKLVELL